MSTWIAYGQTDRGLSRPTNQDAFLVDNRHRLWAVADGMGGHPGGDVASLLVIETLAHLAPTLQESMRSGEDPASSLRALVQQAHRAILTHVACHPDLAGMGTTLVAAHLVMDPAPSLVIANVGDSRAYMIRKDAIRQLTRDHTLVEDYLRQGYLTVAQAASHPQRHVLTRAMGLGQAVAADLFRCSLEQGDLVVLCTDGLTKMLTDEEIRTIAFAQAAAPEQMPQALIHAALDRGGIDNVSVVICVGT